MIISNSWNFVYIHLHKCAGTSVETALSKVLTYNDILIGSTKYGEQQQNFFKRTIGLNKHSGASEVKAFVGAAAWENYFSFAFVRHPLDRLYSLYNYSLRLVAPFRDELGDFDPFNLDSYPKTAPFTFQSVRSVLQSMDFNEYVLNELTWKDPGAAVQSASLCENGKIIVKRVFKVEEMDAAWKRVGERFPGVDSISRLNASSLSENQVSPKLLLSSEATERVLEIYNEDLRNFEYRY